MRRKGIALVSVLVAMVAVLMMALGMSYLAQANLSTGQHLAQQARARQLAEAGIDHALAYLRVSAPQGPVTLRGEGYTAILERQEEREEDTYRVVSTGTAGQARHTAVAVIGLQTAPAQTQNPLFGQGWISGRRITINGGVDLHGSRLHADMGYANLTGQINVCDDNGQNCRNVTAINPPPITGGAGVGDTQCNASGNLNNHLCNNSQPKYQVCPVWQEPSNQNLTCQDAITGQTVRWDQAYRISRPDVEALSQAATGVRVTSPYQDATTKGLCQVTFTSLDPGNATEMTSFLVSRGLTPSTTNVNQLLLQVLPRLSGLRVCVQNNVTLPDNTSLTNVTFYVGGTFQVNGTATLSGVKVVAQGGLNLNKVRATDTRFYTNGNINLNDDAQFTGDSTIASRQAITFNGRANLLNNRALAIISEGDITYNGRADTHAFMWSGGQITFNGTGAFIGGAVSIGGTIRNGGGQFYIRNSNAQNTDLPQVDTGSGQRPVVQFRR